MRILLICTEKLPVPPVRGGAIQTYIASVAPRLGASHDVTILGIQDPDLPNEETAGGIKYARVPGGTLEVYQESISQYLRRNRFDLIHLFNRPRLVRAIREAAPSARIILSMHNDMFGPEKISPEEGAYAVEQASRIITVSDYVGKTLSDLFPQAGAKVRTIYSGVDLQRFAPPQSDEARRVREQLRREHGLSGKKVILFVGRLSPKKGADILVRAMPEVAKRHPDAALVLVGSKWYGEDRISDFVAYVRTLAAKSPVPVVTTGFVPPEHVHHWFWAGDLFVCASQWEEPLARVHYEAMAAGLPIVTTARGGNPEVVRGAGNGIVVENPEDPVSFARAISEMLSQGEKARQMGRQGRALAEQRFGWDRVAHEILSVWAERAGVVPLPAAAAVPGGMGKKRKKGTAADVPKSGEETAAIAVGAGEPAPRIPAAAAATAERAGVPAAPVPAAASVTAPASPAVSAPAAASVTAPVRSPAAQSPSRGLAPVVQLPLYRRRQQLLKSSFRSAPSVRVQKMKTTKVIEAGPRGRWR